MIPPLPSEQHGSTIGSRCRWVILVTAKPYRKEKVREMYVDTFGRQPDRIYSPEESATDFWWMGWVTHKESVQWVAKNERLDVPQQMEA